MKIGITGGSGFIGRWLIRELSAGNDIIVLGRSARDKLEIDGKPFQYVVTDYSIEQLLTQLKNCEAVVHLAAKRIIVDEKATFESFFDNIRSSSNLFEAGRLLNIRNIVNLSSKSVYSRENKCPWIEDADVNPASFYGISKLTVEKLALFYNRKYQMNGDRT